MESLVKERQKKAQEIINNYRLPRVALVIDLVSIVSVTFFLCLREPESCSSNQLVIQICFVVIILLLFDLFKSLLKIAEGGSRYDYIEAKIRLDHLTKIIKGKNQKPPQ